MRERVHHPAGMRELLQVLKVPKDDRTSFKRHVKSLVASGDLIQIRGDRFGLPEKMDLYVGRLQTHPAGYGFVAPERPLDSGGGDIYISNPHLNEAMHGDRVVVRIERIKEGGRAEGRVIRVLERSNTSLVGRYDRDDAGMGHVAPFDRRVLMDLVVPPGQEGGASPGDMVVAELTRWPTATRGAIGRVAEVLGDIDAPGVDTEIIIRTFGIPDAHPADAIAEAVRLGTTVSERDIRGRSDFRDLLTVTIDGEHARDFDDAITLEKLRNGSFWLGVHIADVSHYVQDGSALDREAYDRGTSVYFPERAVHMFPSELATGLCSLNPHVDRLVQSCFMEVDRRGQVVRHEFQNNWSRAIPLDGRPHPKDLERTWGGDSVGHWEGETLVIDDKDIFGSEVNIACKLGEDLACKGEILLTSSAYNALPAGRYICVPAAFEISEMRIECYRYERSLFPRETV